MNKKKLFVLVAIVLFNCTLQCVFAENLDKPKQNAIKIDFMKQDNIKNIDKYQKIVWQMESKDTSEKALREYNFKPEDIALKLIDLNNDNKNDILYFIGGDFGRLYCGSSGCSLGILENIDNSKFENISYSISFLSFRPLYVLNKTTNGYKNIVITGAYFNNGVKDFEEREISFSKKDNLYRDIKGENLLKEYMKRFSGYF